MSKAAQAEAGVEPATIFAALGDPTRLELVSRLADGGARSIVQLTAGLGLSRQGVTKHLRTLEQARVVVRRRVGRESRFELTPESVEEARDYLTRVSAQWDRAIARLRDFVEE